VVPAAPAAPAASAAPAVAAPQVAIEALSPGVRAALRVRLGCEERGGLRLDARERGVCNELLGHGAKTAAPVPTPIAPEIRAYYDAIVQAKQPDPAPVALTARGSRGLIENVDIPTSGHGPGVTCKIRFGGPGGGVVHPAHSLKLGPLPCFIVPPKGPLTPEADIWNPDDLVAGKPPQ
jgi:hypothetical protein